MSEDTDNLLELLTQEYVRICEASLADKPFLARVFDREWRAAFLARVAAQGWFSVETPLAYVAPIVAHLPGDYQQRLDEGAKLLLSLLDGRHGAALVKRLRDGVPSVEEEVLLAVGFSRAFGPGSLSFPVDAGSTSVPEFLVRVGDHVLDVEAKGLFDSARIDRLNQVTEATGDLSWVASQDDSRELSRVRSAVAGKLQRARRSAGRIVVFTQYTPWVGVRGAVPLLRRMATSPSEFGLIDEQYPLAIAYVTERWITGVWFNKIVMARLGVGAVLREQIRAALKDSFYPRWNGVFFEETIADQAERRLLDELSRPPRD